MNLWSSLNGQIGALFIRGVENQHARTEDIVLLHKHLLDAVRTSDPGVVQRAVLGHYVRIPHDNARHECCAAEYTANLCPAVPGW